MEGLIARLRRDDAGQDLIEYGLLLGLITIAVIAVIVLMKPQIVSIYNKVLDALTSAAG